MDFNIHYIDRQPIFDEAILSIASEPWIGFDTEFVGEKTFVPVLCLIQIVTSRDIFLIDTKSVSDLSGFLAIVSNPGVLKITHAGDNDYRLLHSLYGTVPAHTFDTQLAAGFVGYNYPSGFGKIVERELRISLAKSHTVADWEARPIEQKALNYAIEDVKYLPALYEKLTAKLQKLNRVNWAREENEKWEVAGFYAVDPYKEVLSNDFIHQLDKKGKLLLIRLYQWRREKAIQHNIPREVVLQSRHISTVLRASRDTQGSKPDRTLPEGLWRKYLPEWRSLAGESVTDTEEAFLRSLPRPTPEDPLREWSMELLYHLVKKRCLELEISAALLFPRSDFNRLKSAPADFDTAQLEGWRSELLGRELVDCLLSGKNISLQWSDAGCLLRKDV
jgi:ribonuclease D